MNCRACGREFSLTGPFGVTCLLCGHRHYVPGQQDSALDDWLVCTVMLVLQCRGKPLTQDELVAQCTSITREAVASCRARSRPSEPYTAEEVSAIVRQVVQWAGSDLRDSVSKGGGG